MENFTDENEFLKKLEMVSKVEPFNKFNTPRVAQLTQRSNQFNLRTKRYTEDDIEKISNSSEHFSFTFTLEDKFGDNGLICVIILKKVDNKSLFIDTWLMSCRVLKRGMENFVLNTLANKTNDLGYQFLRGEYIPTQKNGMVKDHYKNLGFQLNGEFWLLDVTKYKNKECYIQSN